MKARLVVQDDDNCSLSSGRSSFNFTPSVSSWVSLALVCTEVEELLSLRCQPSPFVSITKDAMEMFWLCSSSFITVEGKSLFYSKVIRLPSNVPEGIEPVSGGHWAGRPLCVETLLVEQGCALTSGGGTDTSGSEGAWLVARLNMVSSGDRESKPVCGSIVSPQ